MANPSETEVNFSTATTVGAEYPSSDERIRRIVTYESKDERGMSYVVLVETPYSGDLNPGDRRIKVSVSQHRKEEFDEVVQGKRLPKERDGLFQIRLIANPDVDGSIRLDDSSDEFPLRTRNEIRGDFTGRLIGHRTDYYSADSADPRLASPICSYRVQDPEGDGRISRDVIQAKTTAYKVDWGKLLNGFVLGQDPRSANGQEQLTADEISDGWLLGSAVYPQP